MGRTRFLLGILILIVMTSWVVTFFFYSRLPPKIPAHFSFDGSFTMGDRGTFFVLPIVNTILAGLALAFYPIRRSFNFPAKKRIKELPKEFTEPIYQRAFQIVVMIIIVVNIMMIFIQMNIAMMATGQTNSFNMMPIYGVIGIIFLYLFISMISMSQMAKGAEAAYKEWKEHGGDE